MYDAFYGLSGKPFQLTPDPRFFFDSKVHHRALAYLRYGLQQGEGFIVITGGIGTGKTTLMHMLFMELENRDVTAARLVTTQVQPEDMLRMVCASFGLAHEGMNKATLLHNLEVVARTHFSQGKRILLVVDEAQSLPAASLEELRMLANFQVEGRPLFQSFLLGQNELRSTLQAPRMEQLRQRIIAAYHLEPLSAEETRSYILFRLTQVGWTEDPQLDDEIFPQIHAFTGGVPRKINSICDRLLLYGFIEEKHALGPTDLALVIAEMEEEIGRPGADQIGYGNAAGLDGRPEGAPLSAEHPELAERLALLEEEVARLKRTVQRERQLLRKAVLLQLDLNPADDPD